MTFAAHLQKLADEAEAKAQAQAQAAISPPKPETSAIALGDLDLSGELMLQYKNAKDLYEEIRFDGEIPPNQKAQVLNTITSILGSITRTHTELINAERMKKLEQCLIDTIKVAPVDVQDQFFDLYRRNLENLT